MAPTGLHLHMADVRKVPYLLMPPLFISVRKPALQENGLFHPDACIETKNRLRRNDVCGGKLHKNPLDELS